MSVNTSDVDCQQAWFAVKVRPKRERYTKSSLLGKGYAAFLPFCVQSRCWANRIRRVERVLFPGYLFARFDPMKRLPVLTTPGVAYIVGTRQGPVPVSDEELWAVRAITESGVFAEEGPFPAVGDPVVLTGGPLQGLHGRLLEVRNGCRLVVSVALLQRSVAAEVDRQWVDYGMAAGPGFAPERPPLPSKAFCPD